MNQTSPDWNERKLIVGAIAIGGYLIIAFACHSIGQHFEDVVLSVITIPYILVSAIVYVKYVYFHKG